MPTQSCRHHAAYQLANQQNPTQHLFLQAHNRELAGPLTVSASYARSQNAAPTMQPAPPMAKSSKVATFTSATLSKAATLKNRVLAPTAAAAVYQPGHESLPANRGKLYHIIACTCLGLTSFACLHKNAHMPPAGSSPGSSFAQPEHCDAGHTVGSSCFIHSPIIPHTNTLAQYLQVS